MTSGRLRRRRPMPILVVEDDDEVRTTVAAMARKVWPEVLTTWSADEALAVLQRTEIALVISDVSMPGMTGIELATAMESRELRVPVVLMSARARARVVEEARGCRLVRAVLEKPFTIRALRHTVHAILESSEA